MIAIGELLCSNRFAQFIAVCRRSKTMSMGLRRHRKGSRLCRRCALPRRRDTPRLRQILHATKCDTLSDLSSSPHREHYQRAYGMDQDVYPWSPIIARPVLRWPDNARVALAVLVNLEHWDWEVPPKTPLAVSPVGGPEGQWRDAECIAHGLARRRIIHIGMFEDEERQYIRDAIAAVDKATGTRPVGWSGPDFQETPHTPDLLAAAGIRYVCDWGNDEQPYKMTPQTGELYALGVNASLDDNYIHLHGRRTINEVNLLWREWFDGLYADGATTGRLM